MSEFSTNSIIKLGANFEPLVNEGQWWRLLTSVFLHLSVMHLAVNCMSLLFLGRLLEPALGNILFALNYVVLGVAASYASYWFNTNVISAGGSGAVFGLLGVFIAFLFVGPVQRDARNAWLQGIGVIVGLNLLAGLFLPVDNAAHIGGLVAGLAVGFVLTPFISSRLKRRAREPEPY